LVDRKRILARVDDPGHPGEAHVGNAVLGLQSGHVVFLDGHPAGPQLVELGLKLLDLPANLRLTAGGPGGALRDDQLGSATAPKLDRMLVLNEDVESELVVIELPGLFGQSACGNVT
jgi:hypothetical protein